MLYKKRNNNVHVHNDAAAGEDRLDLYLEKQVNNLVAAPDGWSGRRNDPLKSVNSHVARLDPITFLPSHYYLDPWFPSANALALIGVDALYSFRL